MSAPEDALATIRQEHKLTTSATTRNGIRMQHAGCTCDPDLRHAWATRDAEHQAHVDQVIAAHWQTVALAQVHDKLRDAISVTSIYDTKITGLLHAAELLGVPGAEDIAQTPDPAKRYLDRIERSCPSPEVQDVIDRIRHEGDL